MTAGQRVRAAVIVQLLREGWRPPPLRTDQADRLLDNIGSIGGDRRHDGALDLTAKERELLALVAGGVTVTAAARQLGVTRETARDRMKLLRRKLGARTSEHAVAIALRQRLI